MHSINVYINSFFWERVYSYSRWYIHEVVSVNVEHLKRTHLKEGGRKALQHVVKQQ